MKVESMRAGILMRKERERGPNPLQPGKLKSVFSKGQLWHCSGIGEMNGG